MTAAAPSLSGDHSGPDKAGDGQPPSTEVSRSPAGQTLFERLFGRMRARNGSSLRDDLSDALAAPAAEGFSPGERTMLTNILHLNEVRVEDVMIPRADIEAVEMGTSLGELLGMFERSGHSRMPAYCETLDDPRGMVHIRDVMSHITRSARGAAAGESALELSRIDLSKSIEELGLVRPLLFVPPSMLASDLMARMQAARIQMALVIDEYGGTDGLASLEDIVEMVVGDIEDEHDEEETLVTRTADGVYVADGKAEIDDVAETVGDSFGASEHAEDVDTIGGMIVNMLGHVPARGDVVKEIPGFELQVLDADDRRVKRVRIVNLGVAADRRRRAQRSQDALRHDALPHEAPQQAGAKQG